MSRYRNTRIERKKNKSYYKTTIFDKVPKSDNDIYVITQYGDRLDLLANQFYGDPTLWYVIANANHIGKGTMAVETGIQLRIPANPYN